LGNRQKIPPLSANLSLSNNYPQIVVSRPPIFWVAEQIVNLFNFIRKFAVEFCFLVGMRRSSRSIGKPNNGEHHLLPWFLSMEKLPLAAIFTHMPY